ncbi:hypothetical protein CDIK_4186, partial [Cucumispora dikerogammari]
TDDLSSVAATEADTLSASADKVSAEGGGRVGGIYNPSNPSPTNHPPSPTNPPPHTKPSPIFITHYIIIQSLIHGPPSLYTDPILTSYNLDPSIVIPKVNSLALETIDEKWHADYSINVDLYTPSDTNSDTNNDNNNILTNQILNLTIKDFEASEPTLPINTNNTNNNNILFQYGTSYLLYLQAYNLLKTYTSQVPLETIPLQKGFTNKEDKILIEHTLKKGYDNYTDVNTSNNNNNSVFAKSHCDLNYRIRKIILDLHSIINTLDIPSIILDYGQINTYNTNSINTLCTENVTTYKLYINEIIKKGDDLLLNRQEKKLKKIKSSGYLNITNKEKEIYWRLMFFDKLYNSVIENNSKRKSGLVVNNSAKLNKIKVEVGQVGLSKYLVNCNLDFNQLEKIVNDLLRG